MKSVLISIRPQWVEKICHKIGEIDGKPIYEKEIEIRKDKPMQVQVPFKCHIYETYDKKYDGIGVCWEKGNTFEHACKKVIGEFTCDSIKVEYISPRYSYLDARCVGGAGYILDKSCLTAKEFISYGKGKKLYGWNISDLKIYDRPKELNEFTPVCNYKGSRCDICIFYEYNFGGCCRTLSRPPQSWCYVEVDE